MSDARRGFVEMRSAILLTFRSFSPPRSAYIGVGRRRGIEYKYAERGGKARKENRNFGEIYKIKIDLFHYRAVVGGI